MANDHSQTREELITHLSDHLSFLKSSADSYDAGHDGEAKRLAVSLRVLFHDTKSSHSLLGQLDRLNNSFFSTAIPYDPRNIDTHNGLTFIGMAGSETRYLAMLDDVPYRSWKPFIEWWNEIVFVDKNKNQFTRKNLVLSVANQDGGAHVDPLISQNYAQLSRHNSLGWVHGVNENTDPIPNAEKAAIRQIAHETLRSLVPSYEKKIEHKVDMFVGGAMVHIGANVPPLEKSSKIGRNAPCPCGSKIKYKKCHGALKP